MAVVVGAPDVDGLVEAAHGQLVVVVGNVRREVGGNAVGAHQHLVLGLVLILALVGCAVLLAELSALVHNGAVLGPVAGAGGQQPVDHGLHRAGVVQGALAEPHIVGDAVLCQIPLQTGDVLGQAVVDQGLLAGLLVGVHILVTLDGGEFAGQNLDVLALIAVLREGHGLLALEVLQITGGQALAELLDLVARVVHIELTGHVVACPVHHSGQAVAQSAAAGVAQVHGAGGVGGNEFHVDLLALTEIGAAVLLVQGCTINHAGKPARSQEQVDEAGAGHRNFGEDAVFQAGQMGQNGIGNLAGSLFEHPGAGHGQIAGHVAVLHVAGDLHDEVGQIGLGQLTGFHGSLSGLGQQGAGLVQRSLARVVILVGFLHLSDHGFVFRIGHSDRYSFPFKLCRRVPRREHQRGVRSAFFTVMVTRLRLSTTS